MRIVHLVDAAQAQAQVQQRIAPPPATAPVRRVQAVNRQSGPDDPPGVGTAPPDDGISLALSPEAREAARQAAWEELRAVQATTSDGAGVQPLPEDRPAASAGSPEPDVIGQLEQQDRDVRSREHAHAAAAGVLASLPTFNYQVGPDGRLYAISGEVKLDTTPVPGDPEATLRKAQQIEEVAFAPGDPSPEDRRAAVMAAALAARARQELARQQEEKSQEARKDPSPRMNEIG